MRRIVRRLLDIRLPKSRSAFLWGPRKVGKTYWIREYFKQPKVKIIDLLQSDVFAEFASQPHLLRERWNGEFTVIDEVQKLPPLLDEVHWLIENKHAQFLLTGSSARKLRRGHANLLGGRAWRYEMGPLSFQEVQGFDIEEIMVRGLLPPHFLSEDPLMDLRSYVADYLKDEIAIEAAEQNLPAFADFLRVAALTNGELINFSNLGREVGVSPKVARSYFEILEDTLLGARLKPWTKAKNRRMIQTEKFYYFDVGLANYLAKRTPKLGSFEFGKSFEHFILMELLNYGKYRNPELEITFWRTSTSLEVDFILNNMEVAIEVKGKSRVTSTDLKTISLLNEEHRPKKALVVSLEREIRRVSRSITICPYKVFLEELWAGDLL
ncbi:MAG: ATP-binding protein [Deltaproteobacteria bacterium]|nr:ATP-binding protein [Deltaproteobacteria bacterium]